MVHIGHDVSRRQGKRRGIVAGVVAFVATAAIIMIEAAVVGPPFA